VATIDPSAVSSMLNRTMSGEPDAERDLCGLIHDELHRIAERLMAHERDDHTLQPTALVNEAYLRLAEQATDDPACRDHFLALAARVMRHVLVDHARGRNRLKRGGGAGARVSLTMAEGDQPRETEPDELLAVHEALARLERLDERKARLIEMRFFGGLSEADAARILGISRATASTDWRFARAWLIRELGPDAADSAPAPAGPAGD
jgi:RNA polymerase sigma factor (TIGR02999 family)